MSTMKTILVRVKCQNCKYEVKPTIHIDTTLNDSFEHTFQTKHKVTVTETYVLNGSFP